jgi:hypothetical protein
MSLAGKKDKRDLKRLANLRECEAKWSKFMVNPDQLKDLGLYLDEKLKSQPCDHTTTLTAEWLRLHATGNVNKTLEAFRTYGGYCDCEILFNVVGG